MSQDNVEVVRGAFESVKRGDLSAMIEMVDPEVELHENVLAPDAAVYHGPEGIKKWFEAGQEAFSEFRFEPDRFIEAGEWVIAPVHSHGRGRQSGAEFSARYATAFRFRGGKAVFIASYANVPEALEAAGVPEQDAQA